MISRYETSSAAHDWSETRPLTQVLTRRLCTYTARPREAEKSARSIRWHCVFSKCQQYNFMANRLRMSLNCCSLSPANFVPGSTCPGTQLPLASKRYRRLPANSGTGCLCSNGGYSRRLTLLSLVRSIATVLQIFPTVIARKLSNIKSLSMSASSAVPLGPLAQLFARSGHIN